MGVLHYNFSIRQNTPNPNPSLNACLLQAGKGTYFLLRETPLGNGCSTLQFHNDKLRIRRWTIFFLIDYHFGDAKDAFSPKR
jgi:hypothetical protein